LSRRPIISNPGQGQTFHRSLKEKVWIERVCRPWCCRAAFDNGGGSSLRASPRSLDLDTPSIATGRAHRSFRRNGRDLTGRAHVRRSTAALHTLKSRYLLVGGAVSKTHVHCARRTRQSPHVSSAKQNRRHRLRTAKPGFCDIAAASHIPQAQQKNHMK